MSADWSRDQVELARSMGRRRLAHRSGVSARRPSRGRGCRRYGMALVIDAPYGRCSDMWVKSMEECGVDGFVLTKYQRRNFRSLHR
jgi:hypothetical protein